MSLKKKTLSGLKWTSLSSIFSAGISFLQLIILARILGPQVYGTMSILMVVIGFANLFVDLGISRIIIHKQENITTYQLYSMYWMNIFLAVLIYLIIFLIAPLISKFYSNINDLCYYIRLISFSFVINAVSMQYVVLFQRDMEFKILETVHMVKISLYFIVALLLALNNFGVLSLIYALLLSNVIYTTIIIYKGWKYNKIRFYFNFSEIKEAMKFGLYFSGSKIIGAITSSLDILIIGKVFSQEELGIYNIAKRLVFQVLSVTMPIVQKVIYPLFGKLQKSSQRLKELYIKTISLISLILVPIYSLLFLLADELVIISLGENWIIAADIIRGFCFYAIFAGVGTTVGSLLTATGKVKIGFYWNLYNILITYFAVYIAVQLGELKYVSVSFSVVAAINIFVYYYFVISNIINVSFFEYYKYIFINIGIGVSLIFILMKLDIVSTGFYSGIFLKVIYFITFYTVIAFNINKENLLYLKAIK